MMRRVLIASLLLLAVCGSATAADYIRIDTDTVYANQSSEWEFYLLRECPDPVKMWGAINAWTLQAVGNATWSFSYPEGFTPFPDHWTIWNLGGFMFLDGLSGTDMTEGYLHVGGAAMPPDGGMPMITTEKFWFSLNMTMGDLPPGSTGDGILIDSVQLPIAQKTWHWNDMTCGQGGWPTRPLFLDKYGSDDNHPVFISVIADVCIPPEITVTPDDDQLSGSSCALSFDFTANPGVDSESPATIAGWTVISGIGAIDSSGHYFVDPRPIGTYSVAVRAINSCYMIDTYSFEVIFTGENDAPYFTNCLYNFAPLDWFVVPVGYSLSYPLYFEDPDTCDDLTIEISSIEYYGDTPFLGTVTLVDNVVVVSTTETDDNIQIRVELLLQDEQGSSTTCELGYDIGGFYCGDVNHLVPLDIDDVVFLLNYVFLSGHPPEPYHIGDVDCSGNVDVDDVVYLVMYIFGGGHAPCDTDGDEIPDC